MHTRKVLGRRHWYSLPWQSLWCCAWPRCDLRDGSLRERASGSTLAAYFVAGFIAAAAAAAGPWQPANQQNLILAVLLPIAVPLAASTLSAAVGLGNANLGIVRQIAEIDSELTEIESDLEIRRREIRNQVAAFTHGPLRGRLAACAMALNFHAAEIGSTTPARTEYITTSVLEHLSSAMDELDALGQM